MVRMRLKRNHSIACMNAQIIRMKEHFSIKSSKRPVITKSIGMFCQISVSKSYRYMQPLTYQMQKFKYCIFLLIPRLSKSATNDEFSPAQSFSVSTNLKFLSLYGFIVRWLFIMTWKKFCTCINVPDQKTIIDNRNIDWGFLFIVSNLYLNKY